jgi:dTDP-4-dehydrorhamnose 3,5-epimerase
MLPPEAVSSWRLFDAAASMDAEPTGSRGMRPKTSAVDASGALKGVTIHGLVFRPTRPVPHEDGHLAEVARADWAEFLARPISQVHITTTLPGRVRAWGLHRRSADRLFVVSGLVRFAVFDDREGSETRGQVNELLVSETAPGLLIIPPGLHHGWKIIGDTPSVIINMPERMYDYEQPDALDLPWDSQAARAQIPYVW